MAAEMMPGAMALRQRAAIRPGHRPSDCQIGQTISGTAIRFRSDSAIARPGRFSSSRSRSQSVRASASISRITASGISNGRIAAAKSWKRRPSNSEKGSSVVARPPMRRKT